MRSLRRTHTWAYAVTGYKSSERLRKEASKQPATWELTTKKQENFTLFVLVQLLHDSFKTMATGLLHSAASAVSAVSLILLCFYPSAISAAAIRARQIPDWFDSDVSKTVLSVWF